LNGVEYQTSLSSERNLSRINNFYRVPGKLKALSMAERHINHSIPALARPTLSRKFQHGEREGAARSSRGKLANIANHKRRRKRREFPSLDAHCDLWVQHKKSERTRLGMIKHSRMLFKNLCNKKRASCKLPLRLTLLVACMKKKLFVSLEANSAWDFAEP
jgi:hypothetical protein